MIQFSFNGRIGDVVYSLWYVKQFAERIQSKVNYHIQTNVPLSNPSWIDKTHMNSTVHMTTSTAQFVKPLLEKCQFINEVTFGDQIPARAVSFDVERSNKVLNTLGGEMRQSCYNWDCFDLPREFWKPVLEVEPNYKYKGKILITLSQRYVSSIVDYKMLEQFKDIMVFAGTEREFEVFNKNYFELKERYVPTNLLEVAQVMKGAVGFIANQTGFFAVAEAIKIPRILLPCDFIKVEGKNFFGPKNVLPLGGWCLSISNTKRLVPGVGYMLGENYGHIECE